MGCCAHMKIAKFDGKFIFEKSIQKNEVISIKVKYSEKQYFGHYFEFFVSYVFIDCIRNSQVKFK